MDLKIAHSIYNIIYISTYKLITITKANKVIAQQKYLNYKL